jgi:SAM-dependent methyltransferase
MIHPDFTPMQRHKTTFICGVVIILTMSLTGRRLIDRFKNNFGRYLRLPSPPYGLPAYWNLVYKDFTPTHVFEWGNLTLGENLVQYEYRVRNIKNTDKGNEVATDKSTTTFAETINVDLHEKGKSIMILGSGYSTLGEDMATHGWRQIIQVDIASKAILDLSERCSSVDEDVMDFIEDDANTLSTFSSTTIDAIVDKGLVDTLFLANELTQVRDIMKTAHRVLKPRGVFCFLSLSQPEYLLPKLLDTHVPWQVDPALPWQPIEVRDLDSVLLYRFQKKQDSTTQGSTIHLRQKTKHKRR